MLKIRSNFQLILTRMIRVEAGSSIPYLVLNLVLSSPCTSLIYEPGNIQRKQYFFYTAISVRCFNILLFDLMGVS
jgi:hypothetical protein